MWFAVEAGIGSAAEAGMPVQEPAHPPVAAGDVRLYGVPLLLYRAWVQHAEALLREYLLVSLEAESAEQAILVHSRASDAIAVLDEHIPVLDFGEDPESALAAVEPGVTADLVAVPVPVTAVAHFAVLNDALDAALAMAGRQELLNPPTQPELVALRMWLCHQVETQLRGAAPVPWHSPEVPTVGPAASVPDELLREVRDAREAFLAADAHGTIVAASRSAATLLGYPEPFELEGTRLVSIIPARYRQAHLAGFTLHQLTGRAPLLGKPVPVPALRRDGVEVQVLLTITVRLQREHEPLFLAAIA